MTLRRNSDSVCCGVMDEILGEKQDFRLKVTKYRPGCCSSVDLAHACEAKGVWFNSQSGNMPALQARSSVGCWRGNHTLMFLSLSNFLPSPL